VEVCLDQLAARRELSRGAELVAAVHLVLVQRDARNRRASEPADVAERAADAAANVEHGIARLEAEARRQVILVAGD